MIVACIVLFFVLLVVGFDRYTLPVLHMPNRTQRSPTLKLFSTSEYTRSLAVGCKNSISHRPPVMRDRKHHLPGGDVCCSGMENAKNRLGPAQLKSTHRG